jgi:hypothetical protein
MSALLAKNGLKVALSLWLLSLALPAVSGDGRTLLGGELLMSGFLTMLVFPVWLGMPFHFLAWISNFAFFWAAIDLAAPKSMAPIVRTQVVLGFALFVNLLVGLLFGWPNSKGPTTGLLANPGYWCWIAAFGISFWTAILARPIHENEESTSQG